MLGGDSKTVCDRRRHRQWCHGLFTHAVSLTIGIPQPHTSAPSTLALQHTTLLRSERSQTSGGWLLPSRHVVRSRRKYQVPLPDTANSVAQRRGETPHMAPCRASASLLLSRVHVVSQGNCFWDCLWLSMHQPGATLRRLVWCLAIFNGVNMADDTFRRIEQDCTFANNAVVCVVARVLYPMLPSGIAIVHDPSHKVLLYRGADAVIEIPIDTLLPGGDARPGPLTLFYTHGPPGHMDLLLPACDPSTVQYPRSTPWWSWHGQSKDTPVFSTDSSFSAGMWGAAASDAICRDVAKLCAVGVPQQLAQRAVRLYPGDVERAGAWAFGQQDGRQCAMTLDAPVEIISDEEDSRCQEAMASSSTSTVINAQHGVNTCEVRSSGHPRGRSRSQRASISRRRPAVFTVAAVYTSHP